MTQSEKLYTRAQQSIPAGVDSPVRAFGGVGGNPLFIQSAKGAYITDADGKHYIDYVGSWGPMILGHAHEDVINAVQAVANKGLSFGAPTELEILLAEKVRELMPSIDLIRFVNSGTEATLSAVRLARGYTKRNKIIKFIGCYHGHCDALLVKAGSGNLTFGVPDSAGVPEGVTTDTLLAEYNNLEQVKQLFNDFGEQIAGVIVEPVAGNMNCVLPKPAFLSGLRELCTQYNSVLIFDEVMTGFRVALGGAQAHYGITPDITTLGKIIGGGMPVGAFGGKQDIMEHISPLGPVYQAGTLSGNPLAMTAGLKTLALISEAGFYERLCQNTQQLCDGMLLAANACGIPMTCNTIGGMFGLFFTEQAQIDSFEAVMACDKSRYQSFFHGMLAQGIYLAPSAYEAGFVSCAHGDKEITATIEATKQVLTSLK